VVPRQYVEETRSRSTFKSRKGEAISELKFKQHNFVKVLQTTSELIKNGSVKRLQANRPEFDNN